MPTQGSLTTRTSSGPSRSVLPWSQEKTRTRGRPLEAAQGAMISSRSAPIVLWGSSMPGSIGFARRNGVDVGQEPAQMPQDVHWLTLTTGSVS